MVLMSIAHVLASFWSKLTTYLSLFHFRFPFSLRKFWVIFLKVGYKGTISLAKSEYRNATFIILRANTPILPSSVDILFTGWPQKLPRDGWLC